MFMRIVKTMDMIVSKMKAWGWVIMVIFTIFSFVKTLAEMNPRVTSLEMRMSVVENRTQLIDMKLNTLLEDVRETKNDVRNIIKVLMK